MLIYNHQVLLFYYINFTFQIFFKLLIFGLKSLLKLTTHKKLNLCEFFTLCLDYY